MRRCLAILALVGLLTAPNLSRTEHVCRFSGEEIAACAEDAVSPVPVLVDDGCCERRQHTALAQMRSGLPFDELAIAPVLLQPLGAPALVAPPAEVRFERPIDARASGPPIFVEHRALLI